MKTGSKILRTGTVAKFRPFVDSLVLGMAACLVCPLDSVVCGNGSCFLVIQISLAGFDALQVDKFGGGLTNGLIV